MISVLLIQLALEDIIPWLDQILLGFLLKCIYLLLFLVQLFYLVIKALLLYLLLCPEYLDLGINRVSDTSHRELYHNLLIATTLFIIVIISILILWLPRYQCLESLSFHRGHKLEWVESIGKDLAVGGLGWLGLLGGILIIQYLVFGLRYGSFELIIGRIEARDPGSLTILIRTLLELDILWFDESFIFKLWLPSH